MSAGVVLIGSGCLVTVWFSERMNVRIYLVRAPGFTKRLLGGTESCASVCGPRPGRSAWIKASLPVSRHGSCCWGGGSRLRTNSIVHVSCQQERQGIESLAKSPKQHPSIWTKLPSMREPAIFSQPQWWDGQTVLPNRAN